MPDVPGHLAQQPVLRGGQHQVIPAGLRDDPLGQAVEGGPGQGAACVPQPWPGVGIVRLDAWQAIDRMSAVAERELPGQPPAQPARAGPAGASAERQVSRSSAGSAGGTSIAGEPASSSAGASQATATGPPSRRANAARTGRAR